MSPQYKISSAGSGNTKESKSYLCRFVTEKGAWHESEKMNNVIASCVFIASRKCGLAVSLADVAVSFFLNGKKMNEKKTHIIQQAPNAISVSTLGIWVRRINNKLQLLVPPVSLIDVSDFLLIFFEAEWRDADGASEDVSQPSSHGHFSASNSRSQPPDFGPRLLDRNWSQVGCSGRSCGISRSEALHLLFF